MREHATIEQPDGETTMGKAAHLGFPELIFLLKRLPSYRSYRTLPAAVETERSFRQALGHLLKEFSDQLLAVSERQPRILSAEQQETVDILISDIAMIYRRLDREGAVCLIGDCETTIAELEELDRRLILLVEEALRLIHGLRRGIPASRWFKREAGLLARDLTAFSEAAEERNYLLGLGWESEFTWQRRSGS
jgi:hypothetical protein